MRINWKRITPRSLPEAAQLCVKYAQQRKNLSVERIADGMGLSSVNTLYKWLATGKMPMNYIRPFEIVCGCNFITQFIATSAHKLVVDMPKAKPASPEDVNNLHEHFSSSVGELIRFYKGDADADQVLGALATLMTQIAGHRVAVEQYSTPELGLFTEDDDE